MEKTKRVHKRILKTVLSLSLALVMALGMAFLPTFNVSAATLSAGAYKNVAWNGSNYFEIVDVSVSSTNFYTLSIKDNYRTGITVFWLYDNNTDEYICYDEVAIGSSGYTTDKFFLPKSGDYELWLGYYVDGYGYAGGNLDIKLSTATITASTIYTGTNPSSGTSLSLAASSMGYLRYTPSSSGDYTISFTGNLHAYIYAYNMSTGEIITQDTEYYDNDQPGWVARSKVVFNLTSGTSYYFGVYNYKTAITSKFAISKNAKTIADIGVNEALVSFDSWCTINEDSFNYMVTYTDSTHKVWDYVDMCLEGFSPVDIYYNGYTYTVNGTRLQGAGNRVLVLEYMGEETYYTFRIRSLTDTLIAAGQSAVGNGGKMKVERDEGDEVWYWRIRVSETGTYDLLSSQWGDLEYSNVVFLDSRNNPVYYNEAAEGYPLIAGEEYALSFICSFPTYSSFDLTFELGLVSKTLFADADLSAWYGPSVTYAVGSGIMKGYADGNFGTSDGIQRQDFLVMLARYEGVQPEWYEEYETDFTDVQAGSYYDWAVAWGYENGIVTGYQDGRFGVGDYITREQIVTFLARYARYCYIDTECDTTDYRRVANTYRDYGDVSSFAEDAVVWAVTNGVISGKTADTIVPQGNAQRCEVAKIMYNIFKNEVF